MQAMFSYTTRVLPLPDHPINALLLRQQITDTLLGRTLLNWHVRLQRLRAAWYVSGTRVLKRGFDILVSAAFLFLAAPLFLLLAALIKWEDGGPVFFTQIRVGRYGREFKMFKIRSMCMDAERRLQQLLSENQHKEGVTFKLKDDPRITRVGRWLRKFSLDELPQLYNVLIGEMSLVGPRPPSLQRFRAIPWRIGGAWPRTPASRASGKSAVARKSISPGRSNSMSNISSAKAFGWT